MMKCRVAITASGNPREEIDRLFGEADRSFDVALQHAQRGDTARARREALFAFKHTKLAGDLAEQLERALMLREAQERRIEFLQRAIDAAPPMRQALGSFMKEAFRPEAPHIYFLVEEAAEFLKMGFSGSKRGDRSESLPRPLRLAAALPGDRPLEQRVKQIFQLEHQRGDWYRVSERLAAFVMEVREGHDVSWMMEESRHG